MGDGFKMSITRRVKFAVDWQFTLYYLLHYTLHFYFYFVSHIYKPRLQIVEKFPVQVDVRSCTRPSNVRPTRPALRIYISSHDSTFPGPHSFWYRGLITVSAEWSAGQPTCR